MLKIHYYVFNSNYIIIIILMLLTLPVIFYNIKYIAENYIATIIDKII